MLIRFDMHCNGKIWQLMQPIVKMHKSDERLCLQWNDFQDNLSSTFGTLRDDKEFTDVTLACEDG